MDSKKGKHMKAYFLTNISGFDAENDDSIDVDSCIVESVYVNKQDALNALKEYSAGDDYHVFEVEFTGVHFLQKTTKFRKLK